MAEENFLTSFWNKLLEDLRNLLKKESSVIGVDIGSSFIKVVQLKKKGGKAVLETYGELATGPYKDLSVGQAAGLSPELISEALQDLLKEANVTTKNSGFSVPLSNSLLSFIEMPAMEESQLARMIPIEARKYIPVPINEVTLDWWIVPKPQKEEEEEESKKKKQNKVDVLVVAIHNETLQNYQAVIDNVGLQNSFMELEIFSTMRSTFGGRTTPVMIFDMGASSTKLAVVEYGVVRSQHIVNRGSQDITRAISQAMGVDMDQAEKWKRENGLTGESNPEVSEVINLTLSHVFSEANRALLNYQRKYNKTIQQAVLTGGGVLLQGLFEMAEQELETEVTFADPFSKAQAPAFLDPVLKDAGPSFSVAMGVALRKLEEIG